MGSEKCAPRRSLGRVFRGGDRLERELRKIRREPSGMMEDMYRRAKGENLYVLRWREGRRSTPTERRW